MTFTNFKKDRVLDGASNNLFGVNSARSKMDDMQQLVTKDMAMRLILNYTWSNPISKINILR